MASKKQDEGMQEIIVTQMSEDRITVGLIGVSPLVMNRMSEKVRQYLLFPPGRRGKPATRTELKHNPPQEYRWSVYTDPHAHDARANTPTLLVFPASGLKDAIRSVTVDSKAASKAMVGRLVYVEEEWLSVYGIPKLYMTGVRTADMSHTPDIRTRAILETWCMKATVSFVTPMFNKTTIVQMLVNAGKSIGLGDGRPEKGKLSFGRFRVVTDLRDPEFVALTQPCRKEQEEALEHYGYYNDESAQLCEWFLAEARRRGVSVNGEVREGEAEREPA